MSFSPNFRCGVPLLFAAVALASACSGTKDVARRPEPSLLEQAQRFRHLLSTGDIQAARDMLVEHPRRWFERRDGPGQVWDIAPGTVGPWENWDRHFRSQKEEVKWVVEGREVVLSIRETNDYFQLLERGWVTNETVYYFDSANKIEGQLIRGVGVRPPGRTDDFLVWARHNEPEELKYLMPGGEIDPGGDRPKRMRDLLNRWRRSEGLPTIP